MRFVCCLLHLNHNFYRRADDGDPGGGEFLNSAMTQIIMFRTAPQRVNFSSNESSHQSETSLLATREVIHSTPLGFSPLLSNSSLPNADNFAEFIGDQITLLVPLQEELSAAGWRATIQRAEASSCSHFNGLNV